MRKCELQNGRGMRNFILHSHSSFFIKPKASAPSVFTHAARKGHPAPAVFPERRGAAHQLVALSRPRRRRKPVFGVHASGARYEMRRCI
jgi:hypothetical protein